jgi:hypothetical protein
MNHESVRLLGGHKSAPVRHKQMLSAFRSAGPQLVFTFNFNNRFVRHQACYSLLPARPREKPERQNVSWVYIELMSLVATQLNNQSLLRNPFSRSECLIRFPCVGYFHCLQHCAKKYPKFSSKRSADILLCTARTLNDMYWLISYIFRLNILNLVVERVFSREH